MELDKEIRKHFRVAEDEFLIITPSSFPKNLKNRLTLLIDNFGNASARAQRLPQVITTTDKFSCQRDQTLYFKIHQNQVIGMLKTGCRTLFYRNEVGNMTEINPLCVLDFYVVEAYQRYGIGKQLYEKMLQNEGTQPSRLAIDRPSLKLLNFMSKHYGLDYHVPQTSNFVIYPEYFGQTNGNQQVMRGTQCASFEASIARERETNIRDTRSAVMNNRHNYSVIPPWGTSSRH